MKNRQHLMVHCGFLEEVLSGGENIVFYGNAGHVGEIQSMLGKNGSGVEFRVIPVIRSGGGLQSVLKIVWEATLVFYLSLLAGRKRSELFLLSSYPPTKLVAEWVSRLLRVRIQMVHHGELDGLQDECTKRYAALVQRYFARRKSKYLTDVF